MLNSNTNVNKALIICHLFPPHVGGVEYAAWQLANYLPSKQIFATVLHTDKANSFSDKNDFTIIGIKTYALFSGLYPLAGFKFFYKIFKEAKQNDYLIIYGRHFTTSILGMIAAKLLNKPYIYIDTGFQPKIWNYKILNFFTKLLDKWVLGLIPKLAKNVICLSEYGNQMLTQLGVHTRKITIVYNSFNPLSLSKYELNNKHKTIIYAGRWSSIKDPVTVFNAFKQLATDFHDWKFEMYGKGENLINAMELKNLPKNMVVQNRNLNQTELWARLAESKIYVNSSISEGMSMAVIEAAALGNVLVLSNNPGNNEVASNFDKQSVVRFSPGNEHELYAATVKAIGLSNKNADLHLQVTQQAQVFESENQLRKIAKLLSQSTSS